MSAATTLPRTLDADPADDGQRGPALFRSLCASHVALAGARHDLAGIERVVLGRGAPRRWDARREPGWLELWLDDPKVSTRHAQIVPALHRFAIEDLGSRNGTFVNGEPVRRAVLCDGDVIELGTTFFVFRARGGNRLDEPAVDAGPAVQAGLTTLLPALAASFARVARIAAIDETVLVHGDTGTGKELVARAVHAASGRTGPFVAVNCAALPEAIVESELFGHRRGAFSGAVADRTGLIRSADGGTLFLDEIGDLRLASQAALLRVLQERQVTPIGSDTTLPVDLRVVCATHQPLRDRVAAGTFRDDLFARLQGFVLTLPPLRERLADLGTIVAELLRRRVGDRPVPALTGGAARALALYDWPHNIRELDKALATALALADGSVIGREHLPERLRAGAVRVADEADAAGPLAQPRRDRLVTLMREYEGNVAAVARALGKARTQVHRWLDREGIDPDVYRR